MPIKAGLCLGNGKEGNTQFDSAKKGYNGEVAGTIISPSRFGDRRRESDTPLYALFPPSELQ